MRSALEVLKQVQDYVQFLQEEGESDIRYVRNYVRGILCEILNEQIQEEAEK